MSSESSSLLSSFEREASQVFNLFHIRLFVQFSFCITDNGSNCLTDEGKSQVK